MERGIFKFIWRFSRVDQIVLVLLSAATLPILYYTFELPKTIINQAIGGEGGFPKDLFGRPFEQIPYLMILCFAFLGLVFINLGFKYFTSTYRYRVGDSLLRRLRFDLVERLMRFPLREFRHTSGGQVVSMITAETSPLGFFMAEAFAVPAVALGTLMTIVLFMFMQNWAMGIAAVALLPVQLYVIPKFQKRINELQRAEVQAVRKISQRVGEVVAGAHEIHGHDTSQFELAVFSDLLSGVYKIRLATASNRYIVNILNTFFSQITPFFFLSIGGYLVVMGEISLGALVAVLAAYKDMYAPWKDLIDYYQKAEDARVKYDQLSHFFEPAGLLDRAMLDALPVVSPFVGTQLAAANVVVESEDGTKAVDGASMALQLPTHAVIVGGSGSGSEELARALSRQIVPRAGRLTIADQDLAALPDSIIGRRIGFVGSDAYFAGGTIRTAVTYGLLHQPPASTDAERLADLREAERVGNSAYDSACDWINYAAAGCAGPAVLSNRIGEVLRIVGIEQVIYEAGLRRSVDPAANPTLVAKLLVARKEFHERVKRGGLADYIESFDVNRYLLNASVAENVLFGTPVGPYFAIENLSENEYMRGTIEAVGLTQEFLEKGSKLAAIMVDIFRDLPPGHEFFERFSFISGEDLPTFDAILRRAKVSGVDGLEAADRSYLRALPFKLIVNQHHVGLIDESMQARLLAARKAFARFLPRELQDAVQFFNADTYNATSSIADNVIFGKVAANRAESATMVGRLLSDVIDSHGLRSDVVEAGLGLDIGVGGTRLSAVQRQRLAIARCLLKRPDILILNDALSIFDPTEQQTLFDAIKADMAGRSVILVEPHERRAQDVDLILRMVHGRIVAPQATAAAAARTPAADAEDLNSVVAMLSRIPLFAGIDRSNLKLLAFTSEHAAFNAGQFVFRQGDPGINAYVVIEGEMEVVLESNDASRVVATLDHHQVFGEMALLTKAPRTTSIRASTPAKLLVISHNVFLQLVEENSAIAANIMRILSERLAATLRDYGNVVPAYNLATELPTQRVFMESARRARARYRRNTTTGSVLLLNFEAISDAVRRISREDLNPVMHQAADRLRQNVRTSDILAHLRDAEFGLIGDFSGEASARVITSRVLHGLSAPFSIGGKPVRVPANISCSFAALDNDDVAQTIERCRSGEATRFTLAPEPVTPLDVSP